MDLFIGHPQFNRTSAAGEASSAWLPPSAPEPPRDEPRSIAGDAYHDERAYDRRRSRRRAMLRLARLLGAVVLTPVVVALVFVASYALTCILEGASPEELVSALSDLFEQVKVIALEAARLAGGR